MGKETDAELDRAFVKLGEIALCCASVEKSKSVLVILPRSRQAAPGLFWKRVPIAYLGIRGKRWAAEWWPQSGPPIINFGSLEDMIEWLRPLIKLNLK